MTTLLWFLLDIRQIRNSEAVEAISKGDATVSNPQLMTLVLGVRWKSGTSDPDSPSQNLEMSRYQ